jgi:hypothetical protein
MENNLENAKEYLLKTNFEFFTQSEKNVIGKTMVPYANYINQQLIKDIEAYKNIIKVLQNLNEKYREKLGISNKPIDALGLISPLDDVAQAE